MGGPSPASLKPAQYSTSDVRHLTGDQAVLVRSNPPRYFEANSTKTPAFSVGVTASFRAADGHTFVSTTLFMRPDVARAYNEIMLAEQVPFSSTATPDGTQVITGAHFDSKLNPAASLAKRVGPTDALKGNPVFRAKDPGNQAKGPALQPKPEIQKK